MRFPASRPAVWAVEDDSVQVVWGNLGAGRIQARVGEQSVELDHVGGAGSIEVSGLAQATSSTVELSWGNDSRSDSISLEFTTLSPPPGQLLYQLATISDLHLGATRWGSFKTMRDSLARYPRGLAAEAHETPHPYRCATAAVEEATAWGAQHLIIKGDAADHRVTSSFQEVDRLVDSYPNLPMSIIPGNHDVDNKSDVQIPSSFGTRELPLVRSVDHLDLPGLRLILVDTTIEGDGPGTIAKHTGAVLELAAGAGPVLIAAHHHFHKRSVPTYWPIGIAASEAAPFLDQLQAVNPNVFLTSGHTHRNHLRRYGALTISEVASTKDWPGVWAGYKVFEGGIMQTVRKVRAPGAVHWHEYSKDAVLGAWQFWARGTLSDRCVSTPWAPVPPRD